MDKPLIVVGLTGGIASGKSSVGRILRRAGAPVVDADALGHLVLEPDGEAYEAVLEAFGAEVLGPDGRIDRQALGAQVFCDAARRQALEAITHPAISRLSRKALALITESGHKLAFYEAALLVETGMYQGLDALVVVGCEMAEQLKRIVGRDGLSRAAAAARIAAQAPLADKLTVADYVIRNDGDFEALEQQTLTVYAALKQRFAVEGP